jgi:excisionase family DNA binding protein
MEPLLTAADAARILDVVPATVRMMALSGRLPVAAKTEGGIRLFSREDVETLARQRALSAEARDETEVAR